MMCGHCLCASLWPSALTKTPNLCLFFSAGSSFLNVEIESAMSPINKLQKLCHWPAYFRRTHWLWKHHPAQVRFILCSITQVFNLIKFDKGSSSLYVFKIWSWYYICSTYFTWRSSSVAALSNPRPIPTSSNKPIKIQVLPQIPRIHHLKILNNVRFMKYISSFCVKILNCHSNKTFTDILLIPLWPNWPEVPLPPPCSEILMRQFETI